jgi:hypothetical protein
MVETPETAPADRWYWEKTWSDFRRGSTRICVAWPGGEAGAVLYDAGVPETVRHLVAHLPLAVPMVHVAWSGDMLMSTRAYDIGTRAEENRVRLVRPGDLAWDPKFGELTVTYGTAEARLPSGPNTLVVYGAVVEGLAALAAWARARRFEGQGELELRFP